MAPIVLALGGAILWVASMAVVVQRQRVLHRRLARIERALGLRRRRPAPAPTPVRTRAGWRHPVAVPAPAGPALPPMPTVKHLARLAVPLQRAGG